MKLETLRDLDFSEYLDKDGKLKISELRLHLKEQSIKMRESIKNNDLLFQEFDEKQKEAIRKFIEFYYD